MALTLKHNYRDVYTKVAEFLGMGSSPTGAELTKVKDITLRGYRRFLMPIDASTGRTYRWYFLQKTTTLSVAVGRDTYKLPKGFSSIVLPFTCTTPISWNPEQKPLDFIYKQKSYSTGAGYPRYFALKTADYDPVSGQIDNEVIFWPQPSNVLTYYYTYNQTPPPPENEEDVFIGDVFASECILECALAVADLQENDNVGIHEEMAERLIQAAIGEDKRQGTVANIGSMNKTRDAEVVRSATINIAGVQILPETS